MFLGRQLFQDRRLGLIDLMTCSLVDSQPFSVSLSTDTLQYDTKDCDSLLRRSTSPLDGGCN